MARYRRRGYRRRPANYIWQPVTFTENYRVNTPTANVVDNRNLKVFKPGLNMASDPIADVDAFENDHTLERVVGSMAHNGSGLQTSNTTDAWFPLTIAALRVPVGFTAQSIDLFDPSDGDDFIFRMDAVCNASATAAQPNWHNVNSKAKRRFNAGDAVQFLMSFIPNFTDTSWNLEVAFNLRFLWKLKN